MANNKEVSFPGYDETGRDREVRISAQQGSNGDIGLANKLVDAGLVLGIVNTFEKTNPPIASAITDGDGFWMFSAPIKSAVLQFYQGTTTAVAINAEMYVAFGVTSLADAQTKLADQAQRQVVPFNKSGEFNFPDAGGGLGIAVAINAADANAKYALEVTV